MNEEGIGLSGTNFDMQGQPSGQILLPWIETVAGLQTGRQRLSMFRLNYKRMGAVALVLEGKIAIVPGPEKDDLNHASDRQHGHEKAD
jgi:hypothetical protein